MGFSFLDQFINGVGQPSSPAANTSIADLLGGNDLGPINFKGLEQLKNNQAQAPVNFNLDSIMANTGRDFGNAFRYTPKAGSKGFAALADSIEQARNDRVFNEPKRKADHSTQVMNDLSKLMQDARKMRADKEKLDKEYDYKGAKDENDFLMKRMKYDRDLSNDAATAAYRNTKLGLEAEKLRKEKEKTTKIDGTVTTAINDHIANILGTTEGDLNQLLASEMAKYYQEEQNIPKAFQSVMDDIIASEYGELADVNYKTSDDKEATKKTLSQNKLKPLKAEVESFRKKGFTNQQLRNHYAKQNKFKGKEFKYLGIDQDD